MRIDHQETYRRTTNRIQSGPGASAVWTLTGVALLAACAHDGTGFLGAGDDGAGLSGGGYTNEEETPWSVLAGAVALIGISFGGGGGGGGGTSTGAGNRPPSAPEIPVSVGVEDTVARSEAAGDFDMYFTRGGARLTGQQQAPADLAFDSSDPEGEGVTYIVTSPDGGHSEPTPAAKFDAASFNYDGRIEGQYGYLYYNDSSGSWTYEAKPAAVDGLHEGEDRVDAFLVTAADPQGARSGATRLEIQVQGADEPGTDGVARWSDNTPKVGDRLTVDLRDDDGLPQANDIAWKFFTDDDTTYVESADDASNGWTVITDREVASSSAANSGFVNVVQDQVGKYIGVQITYTDRGPDGGNAETVTAYVSTAVEAHNHPGEARFDVTGSPLQGTDVAVSLLDYNGIADDAAVTYTFFTSDNADGTGNKDPITPPVAGTDDPNSDYRNHAQATIPTGKGGKYFGVDISYTDGAGNTETADAMIANAILASQTQAVGSSAPRNYGPTIRPMGNNQAEFRDILRVDQRFETQFNTLYFGERGWRDEPQHTPQADLQISIHSAHTARSANPEPLALAEVPHNPYNYIHETQWQVDYTYQSAFGTWRFSRDNSLSSREEKGSNNPREEDEGAIFWTYQLGSTQAQRDMISTIQPQERTFDHMWVQVSDGVDKDIVRLTVDIRGAELNTNANFLAAHTPNPEMGTTVHAQPAATSTGVAPVLFPRNGNTYEITTSVYYEGGNLYTWDDPGYATVTRDLYFGDADDADHTLAMAFHIPQTAVKFANSQWGYQVRAMLEMPEYTAAQLPGLQQHNYNPNHPYYVSGAITHEPGDVPIGRLEIWENANLANTRIVGHYGNFYLQRDDDNGNGLGENAVARSILKWHYQIAEEGNSRHFGRPESNAQLERIRNLNNDEFGVDVLHLQLYDNDGNKSDVRTIMVPIAGKTGDYGTGGIPVHRAWLDSFDNWFSWDDAGPPAAPQSSPQGAPAALAEAYYDSGAIELGDDTAGYDII